MRYIQESRITNKASRETGALTLFSRRAHLLTTDKVGGVPLRGRALHEATNKIGKELIAYRHISS